jgi:hypothetical protein
MLDDRPSIRRKKHNGHLPVCRMTLETSPIIFIVHGFFCFKEFMKVTNPDEFG